ncbi:hypothetical protein KJ742_03515 [Patescibacteria group bacterium]|nr:hypothetical protein [Patescibacteria group bacterium]MBU1682989.1 hypothetical protein [Patescibacteria group bacterium]MBU1935038.1 hypothetical protein [Patescibacteria group bacterium]
MNKLTKTLFTVALIVLLLQIFIGIFWGVQIQNNSPLYFFSITVIILIPYVLHKIKEDTSADYLKKNLKSPIHLAILIIGLLLGIFLIWFKDFSILLLIPWVYFLLSFIYAIDSRIAIFTTTILLGYAFLFFGLAQIPQAKTFAYLAFIFLIIIILSQIREYRLNKS